MCREIAPDDRKIWRTGTAEQQYAVTIADKLMRERLGNNEKLIEKIVPTNFGIGCRRPTPGLGEYLSTLAHYMNTHLPSVRLVGYLESLVAENATTYTESIKKITPDGFLDPDGKEVKVDIIVTATGVFLYFVGWHYFWLIGLCSMV